MAAKPSRDGLKLGVIAIAVVLIGFGIAQRYVSPAPPDTIRMATGESDGAYHLFAERYRERLARNGIEIEIVETLGSVDNLQRLRAGEVDVALVQSGVGDPAVDAALRSLGSVFHEPLWIFLRRDLGIGLVSGLRGRRIQIGPEGSGTRVLAAQILGHNGIDATDAVWLGDRGHDAADALLAGDADAVFLVGSADSPVVASLLGDRRAVLLDMQRAEAYTRRDRSLSQVTLPRGVVDMTRDLPPTDVTLVAAVGELVVGPDFHPALVDLMLQAAGSVHGPGDVFAEPGLFPSPRWIDLPLSPEAERHFEHGPPFLQRYLPFWAATQVDRLKVMLIPLIALLVPLIRIFPPTYRWRVRSRIYRWYRELRLAEPTGMEHAGEDALRARLDDVDRIEAEAAKVPTPTSYAEELYALRLHIAFVRDRIEAALQRTNRDRDGRRED